MSENHPILSPGLTRTEDGKIQKTITNLVICFNIDENLNGLFKYNEFTGRIEYAHDAIWHKIKAGKQLDDDDVIHLQYYLAHNKRFEMPLDKIRNAIIEISKVNSYHPVKNYLNSLEWDNKPRLDEWLIKGCGVEDNIFTREAGRKWLTAAVTRIYEPGIKFDHVLVLEGKENIGKSSTLRILGEPWFTDSISLLQKEADIVAKMQGNWVIELAEMRGMRKQEQEFVRNFISCQYDEQRLAYRRDTMRYPRQSVFAGTSNNAEYIYDSESYRRFWPIGCTEINLKWIKENKDQLFAEAKHRYENKEYLTIEGETLELARSEQKQRLNVDEVLEESIDNFLIGRDEITMKELLVDHIGHQLKELNTHSQATIVGRILKKLGFEKTRKGTYGSTRHKYIRQKVGIKKEIQDESTEEQY